nr:hypothetical protein [Kofleriaceae bacterium]
MPEVRAERVDLAIVPGWVSLRELAGIDEEWLSGRGTAVGIDLLDRLLVPTSGAAVGPGGACTLTAADRDALLAAVYVSAFGARVQASPTCSACGARFDVDFEVPALAASVRARRTPLPCRDGVYTLRDGLAFRLPTGSDELAVTGVHDPDAAERALLERCLVAGDAERDGAAVIAAMEQVAPTLDVDLDARCPECEAPHPVRFDIVDYLLGALAGERTRFLAEVHQLAATYHWGLDEILGLRRSARRTLASMIGDGVPRFLGAS